MALVTICIPAFRAAEFLAFTVRSALDQTFRDIVVDVAIEPPGQEEIAACEPLSKDRRLRLRVNDEVLGWDRNIRDMLRRIDTPYFMILPHDDFLHSRYVEILWHALKERPDAVVAYGDIQLLSGVNFRRRFQTLQENPLIDRLTSFLAEGADAPPWRGLTRSSTLNGGASFPTDQFMGFLVECEWAYHLLTRGPAIRVAKTLYFKRTVPNRVETASQLRRQTDIQKRSQALEDHRQRLAARTVEALKVDTLPPIIECGLDAVIAQRHLNMKLGYQPELEGKLVHSEQACLTLTSEFANRILSNIYVSQSKIALARSEIDLSRRKAQQAVAASASNADAHLQLARVLRKAGDRFGALEAVARACDIAPYLTNAQSLGPQIEGEFLASVSPTLKS